MTIPFNRHWLAEQLTLGNFEQVKRACENINQQANVSLLKKDLVFHKAILAEALIVLSRTVAKMGANESAIFHANSFYLVSIFQADRSEAVRHLYEKAVESVLGEVKNAIQVRNDAVKSAIKYMADHCSDQLSIKDIADKVYLSPYYFSRLFKKETGKTVIEYLTSLRLEKAKDLLRQKSDWPVYLVARQAGFSDPSYFSKLFRKTEGLLPTHYRKA